ncbi:hypothetical protein CYMTET_38385 [Cymbomonas tetramitiformis]|uniref:Uncharacterized protein n=1 Tax=Cymbomonas tetramitiformis TaxID=36881 RepID=A0AAE0CC46_9CHLO|nr:hypothetical protein CYMTET_38385 [Cymbomonas tetramitiformis]
MPYEQMPGECWYSRFIPEGSLVLISDYGEYNRPYHCYMSAYKLYDADFFALMGTSCYYMPLEFSAGGLPEDVPKDENEIACRFECPAQYDCCTWETDPDVTYICGAPDVAYSLPVDQPPPPTIAAATTIITMPPRLPASPTNSSLA